MNRKYNVSPSLLTYPQPPISDAWAHSLDDAEPRPPKRPGLRVSISLRSRERRPRQGVAGVECLHTGLVVTVERRHRAVLAQAEVVRGRVGEPHADVVEVHPDPLAIDQRRSERLLNDQLELGVRLAVLVAVDVADVLGGPERRTRNLQQERGEGGVRRQAAGVDDEDVLADLVGTQLDGDVHLRMRYALGQCGAARYEVELHLVRRRLAGGHGH